MRMLLLLLVVVSVHVLNAACLRFFVNAFSISQSSFRTAYFQYQYKQRPKCHTQIKSIKKAYYTAYVSRIFGRSCSLKLTLKDLIISNKAKQQQQKTERQRDEEETNRRKLKRETDFVHTASQSLWTKLSQTHTQWERAENFSTKRCSSNHDTDEVRRLL